jgi:hypothetical protein
MVDWKEQRKADQWVHKNVPFVRRADMILVIDVVLRNMTTDTVRYNSFQLYQLMKNYDEIGELRYVGRLRQPLY